MHLKHIFAVSHTSKAADDAGKRDFKPTYGQHRAAHGRALNRVDIAGMIRNEKLIAFLGSVSSGNWHWAGIWWLPLTAGPLKAQCWHTSHHSAMRGEAQAWPHFTFPS